MASLNLFNVADTNADTYGSSALSSGGGQLKSLTLPVALVARLESLASQRGCSLAELVDELLLQAPEQAQNLPAGRCSTRLGRCSVGPVPLPYQQADHQQR
ncbi:MAG: CopG family transcriptional regulator [Prochlorococcaceae cyanobacterium]